MANIAKFYTVNEVPTAQSPEGFYHVKIDDKKYDSYIVQNGIVRKQDKGASGGGVSDIIGYGDLDYTGWARGIKTSANYSYVMPPQAGWQELNTERFYGFKVIPEEVYNIKTSISKIFDAPMGIWAYPEPLTLHPDKGTFDPQGVLLYAANNTGSNPDLLNGIDLRIPKNMRFIVVSVDNYSIFGRPIVNGAIAGGLSLKIDWSKSVSLINANVSFNVIFDLKSKLAFNAPGIGVNGDIASILISNLTPGLTYTIKTWRYYGTQSSIPVMIAKKTPVLDDGGDFEFVIINSAENAQYNITTNWGGAGESKMRRNVRFVMPKGYSYLFACFYHDRYANPSIMSQYFEIEEAKDELTTTPQRNFYDKKLPNQIIRIDLNGTLPPNSTVKNDMECIIHLPEGNVNCRANVAWQGSSSLAFAKKNYRLDLNDGAGNDVYVKLGQWIPVKSVDLKANWTDFTHTRNVVGNRLYEQMLLTLPMFKRRPWYIKSDYTANDFLMNFDNGAMGHIDGIPAVLYVNGTFWGAYTFNQKKDKANMLMQKSNQNHVWVEQVQQRLGVPGLALDWSLWEVRNPELPGYAAPAIPPASQAKTTFENFYAWFQNITTNTPKSELESKLIIPFWIDFWIHSFIIMSSDNPDRNNQICTWDGVHWAIMPYDLDYTLGVGYELLWIEMNPSQWTNATTSRYIQEMYWNDIVNRYKELRDLGVLSRENMTALYEEFQLQHGAEILQKDFEKWGDNRVGPGSNNPTIATNNMKAILDLIDKRFWTADNFFRYDKYF